MPALPYDDQGSGEPVLLIHAGVADRSMWSEHLGWLADVGFRAIAVDLPGFGQAAVEPGPQAPWEDVLETLHELGMERTALVGNSFGAAVALRVAAVAPAAVSSLMLVSPPPLDAEPSPCYPRAGRRLWKGWATCPRWKLPSASGTCCLASSASRRAPRHAPRSGRLDTDGRVRPGVQGRE